MFNAILRKMKSFFTKKSKTVATPSNLPVSDHYATITMYIKDDGEFSVASEFEKIGENEADITSMVLHMVNSGLLAEYFIQSLNLWATDDKQKRFILSIIEKWKLLYDTSESLENQSKPTQLAVDPSDVFGLKRLKEIQ